VEPIISLLTNGMLTIFITSLLLFLNISFITLEVTFFLTFKVKSINEPSPTGTRYAIPDNFPSNSGITFPMDEAAPVEVGTIFNEAASTTTFNTFFMWYI